MGATAETTPPGPGFLDELTAKARERARIKVQALKARRPQATRRELADRVVKTYSRLGGVGGAATGALSLVTLPVGLSAGVALTLGLEAELLYALLELYGVETSGEVGRFKLYALWAGAGLVDAAKTVGLKMSADALGHILAGTLPVRIIARLNPALVRFVLKRLGLGWVPRVARLWPLLGAPIGYALDSAALRALGKASLATLDRMPGPGRAHPEEIIVEQVEERPLR